MARVYSWEIGKSPKKYGYIIHPYDVDKTTDMRCYIGDELYGDILDKVIKWTSACTDKQYIQQFEKLKVLCVEEGYNVNFEHVANYMNVETKCDNLRGPSGRGIKYVRLLKSDAVTNINTYAIYYDDDTYDTFEIMNGKDGKDGIDGEPGSRGNDGVSSKFIMIYSSGIEKVNGDIDPPIRPEGGSYDFITNTFTPPLGWDDNDGNITPPIWMSSRTFTTSESSTDNQWSIPVRITGENGLPGVDGKSIEFIFNLIKEEPDVTNLISENVSNYVPDGWTGSPSGINEDNPIEWCSIRTYNNFSNGWGKWEKATIWSKYGVNGQDGDGVQYIYIKTKIGTPPKNPTPRDYNVVNSQIYAEYQNVDNEWIPPQDKSYININDEIVKFESPNAWTDNPDDVSVEYPYQWVSVRKYRKNEDGKKMWQAFTNPALWAKFGEDGKNATGIKKIYALSSNTDNPPALPEGDAIYTGVWGTGFPTGYIAGVNVVWGSEAEVWSHNNEFVKSYKMVSVVGDDGNVIPPDDANSRNTLIVGSLPDEEQIGYLYIKYGDDYYEWKGGWCEPYLVTGSKGENGQPINYVTYVFAYGFKRYTPYKPTGSSPDNPGYSTDGGGNVIEWLDFPDTSGGRIDGAIDENGYERRWYQCCGYVYGYNNTIEKWGEVYPVNPQDGESVYTEFRFAVTSDTDTPTLNQYDSNGNVIREPLLYDGGTLCGWFTTSEKLPELPSGGAMWQIWALMNSKTDNIVPGHIWNGPVRVSGEKGDTGEQGPAGDRGIPGVTQNQMYCLGTENEYFGVFNSNNNTELPENMKDWYLSDNLPDSTIIEVKTVSEIIAYANNESYNGRVIRNITTNKYYLMTMDKTSSGYKEITTLAGKTDVFLYIWCIQGRDKYEGTELVGVTWCNPFKLQGINGLPGNDGKKGQVVYPMGIYNSNEVYLTTEDKAPYVIDPEDGLYYVYNIVNQPWVGVLPVGYESIMDENDKTKYKYSIDGTYGNWMADQNGDTPSNNYANNSGAGESPAWVRFESFQAMYASIGIIENGLIGSAVYNGDFMFSQQGVDNSGNYSEDYSNFNPNDPYGSTFKPNNPDGSTFHPNICINFKTGDMWASQGNIRFSGGDIILTGYIKKAKTVITPDNINRYVKKVLNPSYGTGAQKPSSDESSKDNTRTNIGEGVIQSVPMAEYIYYLDFDKIGSFLEFSGTFESTNTILSVLVLHSLPGCIVYSDEYNNYDDVRSLVGNHIYIVNKSDSILSVWFNGRENGDDGDPFVRGVPIGVGEFGIFNCVGGQVDLAERISWEYEIGKTLERTEVNESWVHEWEKCVTVEGSSVKPPLCS